MNHEEAVLAAVAAIIAVVGTKLKSKNNCLIRKSYNRWIGKKPAGHNPLHKNYTCKN